MGSSTRVPLEVVINPNDKEKSENELLEMAKKLMKIHLINNGEEIRTIKNKKILEKIIENIPENCSVCKSDFSKENFYLIEKYGDNVEVYIGCINDENTQLIMEYDNLSNNLNLGEEIKIVENKRRLELITNNIPDNCPMCESDFLEGSFYLVELIDGCGSETYVECSCGNYSGCVKEYDG